MKIVVLAALLTLLAPVAVDIKTESSRFTITQDGKKIGTEEFTINARKGGGYIAEGTTTLNTEPAPIKCRMELDSQLKPISYEYRRGSGSIRLKVDTPLSQYEIVSNGKAKTWDIRFPENGFIVDSNFFHHVQLLLYKMNRQPGEIEIVVPQETLVRAAVVRKKDNKNFELEIGDDTFQATIDPGDGRLLRLTAPASKVVVER